MDDDDDDHLLPSVLPVLTEDEDPKTPGAAASTDLPPAPGAPGPDEDGLDGLDGDLNLFTAWVCQQPQTPARVAEAV